MKKIIHDQLSRPLNDLRISVIDRCNFRCPYCMPEGRYSENYSFLKENEWLTFDEIIRLTKIFTQLGVTKVRLTGGEPLLRPNISNLIRELNETEGIEDLALTTNGSLLSKYAYELKTSGLQRLTISLDSLEDQAFRSMSGGKGNLSHILEGIKSAEKAGFTSLKINVVVRQGVNDDQIMGMVNHFRGTNHILRFIEYMDVGNCNHWDSREVVSSANIVNLINEHYPIEPISPKYRGEVAKRYRFLDNMGEIGFISSISQPFCQDCSRVRLSADGKLYTCLFAKTGEDLRTFLRSNKSNDELKNFIFSVWKLRSDQYSQLRSEVSSPYNSPKIEMFQIGG